LRWVKDNCARLGVTCVETRLGGSFRPHPNLAPEPGDGEREKDRPHPGPLPQGEGETVPAYRRLVGAEFAMVRRFTARMDSGESLPEGEGRGEGELFDKILVDAPCSNTGVLRRRVDLRWRIQA